MKYKFYSKKDSSKEALNVFTALNLEEAYQVASKTKNLTLEKFKELFKVEKI